MKLLKLMMTMMVAFLSLMALASCQLTPEQKSALNDLAQAELERAVSNGSVQPGDVVRVQKGYAFLSTLVSPTPSAKKVPLSDAGLQTAYETGQVKPNDTVLITEAGAVVLPENPPPVVTATAASPVK